MEVAAPPTFLTHDTAEANLFFKYHHHKLIPSTITHY